MVVSSAVDFGKTLYVGGSFSKVVNNVIDGILYAENIAMFYLEVGVWDELAQGLDGAVNALTVNDAGLFVGGFFTTAYDMDGNLVSNTNLIARWSMSATAWASVGGGISGTEVNALTIDPQSPNNVYVGGNFYSAGNIAALNIAKWAGNHWESVGNGLNGTVYDIAVVGSNVYAAGQFFTEDFMSFYIMAKWDGSSWSFIGDPINPEGQQENYNIKGLCLAVQGNDILLGGHFESMGGTTVNHVARWNGTSWSDLTGGVHDIGSDFLSGVKVIAVKGSDVYVGGTFSAVGGN
jgi:hypothetical protein